MGGVDTTKREFKKSHNKNTTRMGRPLLIPFTRYLTISQSTRLPSRHSARPHPFQTLRPLPPFLPLINVMYATHALLRPHPNSHISFRMTNICRHRRQRQRRHHLVEAAAPRLLSPIPSLPLVGTTGAKGHHHHQPTTIRLMRTGTRTRRRRRSPTSGGSRRTGTLRTRPTTATARTQGTAALPARSMKIRCSSWSA